MYVSTVYAPMYGHTSVCPCRPEDDVECPLLSVSALFFESVSHLPWSGVGSQKNRVNPSFVSLTFVVLEVQTCGALLDTLPWCWTLNPGLHTFAANTGQLSHLPRPLYF